jgi:hypothetical protein
MAHDAVDPFLADARSFFGAADVHTWVLPLIAGGHLTSIADTSYDRTGSQELARNTDD